MILCEAPSPDDSLRCDQEMGHLAWHRCDGTEWYGDSWAVSEWADTQEALPVDPEPTLSALQWDAERSIWRVPVDENGNYIGPRDAKPAPVETKPGTKILSFDERRVGYIPPPKKSDRNLRKLVTAVAARLAVPLIIAAIGWMTPHTSDPTTPAAAAEVAAPTRPAPPTPPAPAKAWDIHGHKATVTKDKLTYANPWWLHPIEDSAGRLHWPQEQWGGGFLSSDYCLEVAEFHKAWGCAAKSWNGLVDITHQAEMHGWDSETYYVVNLTG